MLVLHFSSHQPIFPKVPPEKMTADRNDMRVPPEANAMMIFVANGEGMSFFSLRHTVNGAYVHIRHVATLCFVPVQFASIDHEIRSFHI